MAFRKRKHQGIDNVKAKCVILAETTTNTTKLSLKLVNLNEDVLEKIFFYLNADDLVNTVKMDRAFLSSARRAFRKKYLNNYIELPLKEISVDRVDTKTKTNFKRNADLLRNFGESISKMKISMDEIIPPNKRIFRLIEKTCRETLTEIELWRPSTELKINNCFTKLHTLKICEGSVGQSILQFHKWFPMLKTLLLDCVNDTPLRTRSEIKWLECLSVDFSDERFSYGFHKVLHIQDINRFIQCNPQLRELRLTIDDDMINTKMRENHSLREDIFPEKQMTVKLKFINWRDDSETLPLLKIPHDRIEHLEVTAEYLSSEVRSYVAKCVNLKTLKVSMDVKCFQLKKRPGPYDEEVWINSAQHECLTHLELSIHFLLHEHLKNEDYSNMILLAIRPYMEHCKSLNTIMVRSLASRNFHSGYERLPDRAFDTIRAQNDIKMWTFAYEVLQYEYSFKLTKL